MQYWVWKYFCRRYLRNLMNMIHIVYIYIYMIIHILYIYIIEYLYSIYIYTHYYIIWLKIRTERSNQLGVALRKRKPGIGYEVCTILGMNGGCEPKKSPTSSIEQAMHQEIINFQNVKSNSVVSTPNIEKSWTMHPRICLVPFPSDLLQVESERKQHRSSPGVGRMSHCHTLSPL